MGGYDEMEFHGNYSWEFLLFLRDVLLNFSFVKNYDAAQTFFMVRGRFNPFHEGHMLDRLSFTLQPFRHCLLI
ncbi:MAG: hypothetical protein LBG86_02095 [Puniceicoccales bacterium]|nr:hypothetical protein [Puniceicoccales bacterium]